MRRLTIAAAVLMLLIGAALANASTITASFSDNTVHWGNNDTGWKSVSSPWASIGWTNDYINGLDNIGVPDIFGGDVTGKTLIVSGNGVAYLKSITINYNSNLEPGYNNILRYGDLFLATGTDPTTWNYVVQGDHSIVGSGTAVGYNSATSLAVRSFSAGISQTRGDNDDYYLLSNTSTRRNSTAGWGGFVIRYDHPWALSDKGWGTGTADGTAGFSGWLDNKGLDGQGNPLGYSTWTFDDNQILLGVSGNAVQPFRLGFSPQCANDVLLEDITPQGGGPLIPEPASLVVWSLLGLGGAGLYMSRRRRHALDLGGGPGRQRWSPEARTAIHEIIRRGRR